MFSEKIRFTVWLFTVFMISSTSSVLRESPISKGKTVKILRCGDQVEPSRRTTNQSDYGRWIHVSLKGQKKLSGWIPKSVITKQSPVCPLSHIPLSAINPGKMSDQDTAIKDEQIEGHL